MAKEITVEALAKTFHEHVQESDDRFNQGTERMNGIATTVETIEKNTNTIKEDTESIVKIVNASKGFIMVLGWIGVIVKYLSMISAGLAAVWAVVHHGFHK